MKITELAFINFFYIMILLQLITPSLGQFTVAALREHVLVSLGGEAELSCQLSPPQSAEHMEIRWFKNRYTQPVHLYKNGKNIYGETVSRYVERTELLKEDIGEGKVTLRISGVTVDDEGPYHCLFQDGDFYDEAITELKVTATNVETQIFVHPSTIKGIILECNSEGWYPQPQMEWRDDRGKIIPPTSESHSQDKDKLFITNITLILRYRRNVTCYLRNPVTGQEEITRIVLQGALFSWITIWILILLLILALLFTFSKAPWIDLRLKGCSFKDFSPRVGGILILIISISLVIGLTIFLHHYRAPASEPYTQLDNMWLEDVTVVLYILIVFITMFISFIYFKIREFMRILGIEQASGIFQNS